MINWELLNPRNIFVVGLMAVIAYAIYAYFANKSTKVMEAQ